MSKSEFIKENSLHILLAFVESGNADPASLSNLVKASVKAAEELYEECRKYEEKPKPSVENTVKLAGM